MCRATSVWQQKRPAGATQPIPARGSSLARFARGRPGTNPRDNKHTNEHVTWVGGAPGCDHWEGSTGFAKEIQKAPHAHPSTPLSSFFFLFSTFNPRRCTTHTFKGEPAPQGQQRTTGATHGDNRRAWTPVPSQPAHRVGSECTREPSGNLPIHTGPPHTPTTFWTPSLAAHTPARFRTSASNTSLAA